MRRTSAWVSALLATAIAGGVTLADEAKQAAPAYEHVVAATAGMVGDAEAQRLAAQYGLQVMNVTWEDTGRDKGSSVGPNISDMTIQVAQKDARSGLFQLTCMPVIRLPNFEDVTADLPIDRFHVLVGNERGQPRRQVTLRALLSNLRQHLSDPLSWKGTRTSLLTERDTHVLVSAQACFLPVPREGVAEFNPVLFNYQSYAENPAVLTILVTPEGTSVTVIDNTRDGFGEGAAWGQRLFFNQHGQRASLTGQRQSDVERAGGGGANPIAVGNDSAAGGGLNQVLLIQVPLKQKNPRPELAMLDCEGDMACAPAATRAGSSDVEEAVIGHGAVEGPFTELAGLDVERDERFPIRVTVQLYKATSNGVVNAGDMEMIAGQLQSIYADADAVGSLVTQGQTGRVTEHCKFVDHPAWWGDFWARYQQRTGQSPEQAQKLLHELTGRDWVPPSEAALQDALERAGAAQRPTFPGKQSMRCGTLERMVNEEALARCGTPDAPAGAAPTVALVGALAACCFLGGLRWLV
jgi:hypothetical protein